MQMPSNEQSHPITGDLGNESWNRTFQKFIGSLPDLVAVLDEESRCLFFQDSPRLGILDCNYLGKTAYDLFPSADADRYLAAIMRTIETGEQQSIEYHIAINDEFRWFDAVIALLETPVGEKRKVLWFAREITGLKLAESRLRSTKMNIAKALERSPVGMAICSNDDSIIEVNPVLCSMLGYSAEELTRMTYKEATHPDDIRLQEPLTAKLYSGEIENFQLEKRYVRKDGAIIWCRVSAAGIPSDEERVDYSVVIVEDITLRKAVESERDELEKQRLHSNKMEAIGTLSAGIAHDFNNILGGIMLNTELIIDSMPAGTLVHQYAVESLASCRRARDLVDQILTFGRHDTPRQEAFELVSHIRRTMQLVRATVPSSIEIIKCLHPEQVYIYADPTQISQIIINLCRNAALAMDGSGGRLTVDLDELVIDSFSAKRLAVPPGLYCQLSVTDNGCGISSAVQEHIFEPFFTTRKPGEGSGMGLAVVHGIVQRCGGTISIESSEGRGTTVAIILPQSSTAEVESAGLSTMSVGGSETILLVDDETSLLWSGSRILENHGYKVVAQSSSVEALRWFENNPMAADVVITDLTMPEMLGIELAQRIKSVREDIPVLLVTGFSNRVGEISKVKHGIDMVINKPWTQEELCLALRSVLDAGRGDG